MILIVIPSDALRVWLILIPIKIDDYLWLIKDNSIHAKGRRHPNDNFGMIETVCKVLIVIPGELSIFGIIRGEPFTRILYHHAINSDESIEICRMPGMVAYENLHRRWDAALSPRLKQHIDNLIISVRKYIPRWRKKYIWQIRAQANLSAEILSRSAPPGLKCVILRRSQY